MPSKQLQIQVAAAKQGLATFEKHFQNDTLNILGAYRELVQLQTRLIDSLLYSSNPSPKYRLDDDSWEEIEDDEEVECSYNDLDFDYGDYDE